MHYAKHGVSFSVKIRGEKLWNGRQVKQALFWLRLTWLNTREKVKTWSRAVAPVGFSGRGLSLYIFQFFPSISTYINSLHCDNSSLYLKPRITFSREEPSPLRFLRKCSYYLSANSARIHWPVPGIIAPLNYSVGATDFPIQPIVQNSFDPLWKMLCARQNTENLGLFRGNSGMNWKNQQQNKKDSHQNL